MVEGTRGELPHPRVVGQLAAPLLEPAEHTAAQKRLGLLVEASARIADELDLAAVAEALAGVVVPSFAGEAFVDLVERLFRPDHAGDPGTAAVMCRVARVTEADRPGDARPEREWLAYLPGSPAAQALAGARPRLDADASLGTSTLYVPLVARGRVLGVAGFVRPAGQPSYGGADLALGEELAARAALAIDNVRLYDEARATAVALQRSLLPTVQPSVTGVDTAQRYLPGSRDTEVGGDWFDVMPLSCGRVAFVIGDVMGRGLRAAAAMGQLRTAVRMLAVLDPMPDDVLSHLDDLALGTAEVQLATCVYAVFDPVSRELSYATAGHLPPALREPDGRTRYLPQPSGAPLGVGGVPYERATVAVPDGSRLLLYTDGLVESRDSDIGLGLDLLRDAFAASPQELDPSCDHLLDALGRADGHDDDVALIVAELHGLDADRVRGWRLRGEVSEVAELRSQAGTVLAEWGLGALVETAELLVSELVTNGMRHAVGPMELQVLLLDDVVTIAVVDADSPLPRLRRASFTDEGGRGLHLVATLARRWGARPTATGKVVWCELPRRHA